MRYDSSVRLMRLVSILGLIAIFAARSAAHPMGNFSVNHYAGLSFEGGEIRITYRIDYAEIPSVHEIELLDANQDQIISDAERDAYLAKKAAEFRAGVKVRIDNQPVELTDSGRDLQQRPGAADLPTLLVTLRYRVALSPGKHVIDFADENFPDRLGWREIVASGQGIVKSDVLAKSTTNALENYPELTTAPLNQREARIVVDVGANAIASANGTSAALGTGEAPAGTTARKAPTDPFSRLIASKEVSTWIILVSLLLAFALGTVHGLSPGHGKTIVAAYLVGSRGTPRHAALLGVVVTITHVAAVFALGLIVLLASKYVMPESVYPWLGFVSGVMIAAIGVWQFTRRFATARTTTTDEHGHSHALPDRVTLGSLVTLGISGGIVPCPSALVVLLSAIALKRVGFGLVLIVSFSMGLAAVLIAIGMTMLYARRIVERFEWKGGLITKLQLASPVAIVLLGGIIAVQSAMTGKLWTM
jgi:nickel/cobalt transporter (NicO) family protein